MTGLRIIGVGGIGIIGARDISKKVALTGDYDDLKDLPQLSEVAISGSYNDLKDLPELLSITQEEFNEVFSNW